MINTFALKTKKTFPKAYPTLLNIKQGRYNYTFSKERYPHHFLANYYPYHYKGEEAPEVIYCFWTGDNPLTENRKKGIEALEKNTGIPVKLITPKNLSEYIKPEYPLHKGYELLSLTMRSDYLRCYFMHHYGGGYADIKPFEHSWKGAFEKLNKDKNKYVAGYPELLFGGLAPVEHRFLEDKSFYKNYDDLRKTEEIVFNDLTKFTPLLIGFCSFICKPYTPITTEWYEEVHRRMDELCEYHSQKGGEISVPYFYLGGLILHPIILKYHQHILRDKKLLPILKDYR